MIYERNRIKLDKILPKEYKDICFNFKQILYILLFLFYTVAFAYKMSEI